MEKIKEVYHYHWQKNKDHIAVVTKFSIVNKIEADHNCKSPSTQDDWQFLHDLSVEVLKMYEENKE